MFDNGGNNTHELPIEVVEIPSGGPPPIGYNPGLLNTFSFVYGIGGERSHDNASFVKDLLVFTYFINLSFDNCLCLDDGVGSGWQRRRIGTSPRDYTVCVVVVTMTRQST